MPELSALPLTATLTQAALGFQRTLAHDPCRPDALIGISLVALASQQNDAAIHMAQAAVAASPAMVLAWVTLGQAFKAAKRTAEAESAYRRAVSLDGMNSLARAALGELCLARGDAAGALREYELALQSSPIMVAALLGRGHALGWLGRNNDALTAYEQARLVAPRVPEAEFALAFIHQRLGHAADAERAYRRAIALRPEFAAAWMNLGCLLREQGQDLFAQAALERAVQLRPDMIAGWLNLSLVHRDQGRIDQAEEQLRRATEVDPDDINTLLAWCHFRLGQRNLSDAWNWLRKALELAPRNPDVVNTRGILLHTGDCFEEAVEAFLDAEQLGCLSAPSNRGNSLMDLGRFEDSLQAQRDAVARDPNSVGSNYNLALTELRLGDWGRGWPRYEYRLRFREVVRNPIVFRQPRWNGDPFEGRTLLLHAEQGLGDAIQFARYAPLVAARGGTLVLHVHEPAVRLMQSLAVVRSGQAVVAPLGEEPPSFHLECPLMSLPALFHTAPETVPWSGPYLAADPALAREKRALFPGPGLRVGFAWAGNPKYKADHRRSMQATTLEPLLRSFSANWISLQKGESAAQLAELPEDLLVHDGSSSDADLAETAALIATLDLVVTTDTSIAHLAGALGKPVWIMLPHLADWRWMLHTETTPWYPTARLFRQQASGDWAGVFARIGAALARFANGHAAPLVPHSALHATGADGRPSL